MIAHRHKILYQALSSEENFNIMNKNDSKN